jgi:hypothetical protein
MAEEVLDFGFSFPPAISDNVTHSLLGQAGIALRSNKGLLAMLPFVDCGAVLSEADNSSMH